MLERWLRLALLGVMLAACSDSEGGAEAPEGVDAAGGAWVADIGPGQDADAGAPDTPTDDEVEPDPDLEPGPLGLPMMLDGVTRVGVASVDITPVIAETFEDLDGDHHFDGCVDDPLALGVGCDEPFDDADGDGHFDAVWIGGFSPKRAAASVHDPLSVRSMVIVHDGEYVIFTGMDVVGVLSYRIDQARAALAGEDGMDPAAWLAAASHNHQGPDTFGIWGWVDLDAGHFEGGFDVAYQEALVDAMVASVRAAAAGVEPVEVVMGMADVADASPWFSGRHFGGDNPSDHVHGLIRDIRDPVVASTRVFVMHARRPEGGGGVATLLNFSGHPETWGGDNQEISADWVGVARDRVDAALGGVTVFMPESLGGMQSTLGAPVPEVGADGGWLMEAGQPVWAPKGTWAYVRSVGVHVADVALSAVSAGDVVTPVPIDVQRAPMKVLIDNPGWAFGSQLGIADIDLELIEDDPELCEGLDPTDLFSLGCLDTWTWRVRVGPLGIVTAPGELLPEIFHGFPDDPRWAEETADVGARGSVEGRDSAYFPQHPPACDVIDYEDCRLEWSLGDCDCLAMHDVPYHHSPEPQSVPPLRDLLPADVQYRVAMSCVGNYLSYLVPDNDFNRKVSLLEGPDGDHYEDTVSASSRLGTTLQEAQLSLD